GLDEIAVAITGKAIGSALKPRYATYGPFLDAAGEVIDHGLTFWFPGPDSYTGEDVLEFQGHGGPVVMQILLNRILQAGQHLELRIARPGEFTERAFLNNKLDLAQAEAVADLIDASSAQAARSASRSLAGEFSQRVNALVGQLTHLRMLVEATLDFPEEEVDALEGADAAGQLAKLQSALTDLQQAAGRGVLLRDGMSVVIAGAPNVGKSSLLNALAGEESAIVSPIAGTTRDKVSEDIQIDGVPLHIVDTAGLHDTDDAIERIGIERTRAAIARADVVLHVRVAHHGEETACLDDALASEVIAIARSAGAAQLDIFNKIDLLNMAASSDGDKAVWLSADTGLGLDLLRARLLALAGWQGAAESQFIARERHLQALNAAQGHLTRANQAWAGGLELLAEELRLAQRALSAITGEFTADDLLGEIFSSFCIGK
ncbi:MAG: tRNA uridine-5-carboxymethylaminomethyl(34) synthesis GTPase MnmE, partial [Burkholderiaceae bacterium]